MERSELERRIVAAAVQVPRLPDPPQFGMVWVGTRAEPVAWLSLYHTPMHQMYLGWPAIQWETEPPMTAAAIAEYRVLRRCAFVDDLPPEVLDYLSRFK